MPLIAAQLGPRRVSVTTVSGTQVVEHLSVNLPEIMLLAAKAATGAVSFGRPPADLTGSAA
jgi:hypothetical protein